jgi:undecaprenyl diphosphate synthase
MDGNGRWAANKGLLRVEGHRNGVDSVNAIIRCCLEHSVPVLSLFAFSSENWARPEAEVSFLMDLFLQALNKEVDELNKQGVSLRFTGCRKPLSPMLQEKMQQAEKLTENNHRLIVNVGINYGGRWDILEATKKIACMVRDGNLSLDAINEAVFIEALDTQGLPDPDLLIRTSGEQRLSNFFLWQTAYTELYFSEVHWPDFDKTEFEKALLSFSQRDRRYGKITELSHEADTANTANESAHV